MTDSADRLALRQIVDIALMQVGAPLSKTGEKKVEQALRAADEGVAYHWPTIASTLRAEVLRLRVRQGALARETLVEEIIQAGWTPPREIQWGWRYSWDDTQDARLAVSEE